MPTRSLPLAALALGVGVVDGLVFLGFEWVVNHGTEWVWNDFAGTDDVRWRVVPLAIALSIAFSAVLRLLGEARRIEPHLDPMAGADGGPPPTASQPRDDPARGGREPARRGVAGARGTARGAGRRARRLGRGATRGSASVAGCSSRPASGALLVAFLGSLIALAIPLILLRRRLSVSVVAAVVVAGVAAFAVEELLGHGHGFGSIPAADVRPRDYAAALVLGAAGAGIGVAMRWCVRRLARVTARVSGPWWFVAAVFGAVLGGLYLLGGETVQFSGNKGAPMLLDGEVHYGAWALAGLALVKLAVTGWSLAAGYRGGLVFPSVFIGVAVSLCAAEAVPAIAGPGVLLGCVAGLLVALSNPAMGAVMLLALLPGQAAAAGSRGGGRSGRRKGRFRPGRLISPPPCSRSTPETRAPTPAPARSSSPTARSGRPPSSRWRPRRSSRRSRCARPASSASTWCSGTRSTCS